MSGCPNQVEVESRREIEVGGRNGLKTRADATSTLQVRSKETETGDEYLFTREIILVFNA
jgi:hypothetical protein